jgi:pyruvate dehydrogenase E1 component alpha subunit
MLSSQIDGDDRVGVAFFGDGASNEGVVFETMNMAAMWDLPMIFLCENNQYAISTSSDYSVPTENISDRAQAFDMPGKTIDGQDVLTVYDEVSESLEEVRNGGGPQLIECETYRYFGHFSAEDELLGDRPYRTEEEIQEWRENRDPIKQLKEDLIEADIMAEGDFDAIDDDVDDTIEAAVQFMEESDEPPGERALEGVYAEDNVEPAEKYQ